MTRIKICGLTRAADVRTAVQQGVDALGFVFYPPSKRYVTAQQAAALRAEIPPFVTVVALFVNAAPADVGAVLDAVQPHVLQFHGDESDAACRAYGRPWLKALRVPKTGELDGAALAALMAQYPTADACLLDSDSPGYGGSGTRFDHGLLDAWTPSQRARLILSGGLTVDNVAAAIERVRPAAVDVSSGVEDAPGLKNAQKMARFIAAVRQADGRLHA